VISDVVKDSPAEKAGVLKRDIVVSVDGEEFARFSPDRVVTAHFEREILSREPGETMRLGIVRGSERIELSVTLGEQPTPLKEARRRYFEGLGITLREFVLFDSISRRLAEGEERGVVVNFVKPNSPANAAGLRNGDLIREIDGVRVESYDQSVELMSAIESDAARTEFVLLVGRGTETSLIRVRLK
jgi:serine protease Do